MNRRFFISSSIAVGGWVVMSRMTRMVLADDLRLGSGGSDVSPHPGPLPKGEGVSANLQGEGIKLNKLNSKSKGIKKVIKTDAEWKRSEERRVGKECRS